MFIDADDSKRPSFLKPFRAKLLPQVTNQQHFSSSLLTAWTKKNTQKKQIHTWVVSFDQKRSVAAQKVPLRLESPLLIVIIINFCLSAFRTKQCCYGFEFVAKSNKQPTILFFVSRCSKRKNRFLLEAKVSHIILLFSSFVSQTSPHPTPTSTHYSLNNYILTINKKIVDWKNIFDHFLHSIQMSCPLFIPNLTQSFRNIN